MAVSRVLEPVRGSANAVDVGTRSGVQRSIRIYECEGSEVDSTTADRLGRHLCLAAIAPSRVLHQAETHMKLPDSLSERFWWAIYVLPEGYCIATDLLSVVGRIRKPFFHCIHTRSHGAGRSAFDFVHYLRDH